MADIAIVGLGNLGSRHLQGLAKCTKPLRISLHDPSPAALETARQRWEEAGGHPAALLAAPLARYELAIIATTADTRPKAVADLADIARVDSWLLEKPLAQSAADAQQIAARVDAAPAWVNLPRRCVPWYQAIQRKVSGLPRPLTVTISSLPRGLAGNATHFVDLVRWWTGAEPVAVDTSGIDAKWHESKRRGYFDVFGSLLISYEDGTQLHLESTPDATAHVIDVTAGGEHWRIAEKEGICYRNGVAVVEGRMEFQSALTGAVADTILAGDQPQLPTLAEVARIEGLLLGALLPRRAASGGPADRLDIT